MNEIELRVMEGDRVAFVAGWDVPVWSIVAEFEAGGRDLRRAARRLRVPVGAVRCAVEYAAAHVHEIRTAIHERPGGGAANGRERLPAVRIADEFAGKPTTSGW